MSKHPKEKQYQEYQQALNQHARRVKEAKRLQRQFRLDLSGLDFEKQVASVLTTRGHKVRATPPSGDQGVDLVIDEHTIVQCKAHARRKLTARNAPGGFDVRKKMKGTNQEVSAQERS